MYQATQFPQRINNKARSRHCSLRNSSNSRTHTRLCRVNFATQGIPLSPRCIISKLSKQTSSASTTSHPPAAAPARTSAAVHRVGNSSVPSKYIPKVSGAKRPNKRQTQRALLGRRNPARCFTAASARRTAREPRGRGSTPASGAPRSRASPGSGDTRRCCARAGRPRRPATGRPAPSRSPVGTRKVSILRLGRE